MKEHELKCLPSFFADVADGSKTFEVRRDDRGGFRAGDILHLRAYVVDYGYTGEECRVKVLGVWRDVPGVQPDHVVMTIERQPRTSRE